MKKIMPMIPLVFWILLYPLIGGLIYWGTGSTGALYISVLALVAIFNLIWYILMLIFPMERQPDLLTTIGNLMILNLPAYFAILEYYGRLRPFIDNYKESVRRRRMKKDKVAEEYNNEEIYQDMNYSDWELENLKQLDPKKYAEIVKEISKENKDQAREDDREVKNLKRGKLPERVLPEPKKKRGESASSAKEKSSSAKSGSTKSDAKKSDSKKSSAAKSKKKSSSSAAKSKSKSTKAKTSGSGSGKASGNASKSAGKTSNNAGKDEAANSTFKRENLSLNDAVLYAFGVFILVKIYNSEPEIKITSQITDKFKHNIEDEHLFTKNLLFFKEIEMSLFFDEHQIGQLGTNTGNRVYEVVLNAKSADIFSIFKTNRVQMQKDAKVLIEEQVKNR